MLNKKNCLLASIVMFFPLLLIAQSDLKVKDISPYSKIGLGDLLNQNFTSSIGMGGLSATLHGPLELNMLNPASLGFLEATAFDVGINAKYANLQNENEAIDVWSGDLNYISLGFALRNKLNQLLDKRKSPYNYGMQLTLIPYSRVNYAVRIENELSNGTISENLFTGEGGTYKFVWGNGFRYKDFSVGLNLGYLFGQIKTQRTVGLQDVVGAYETNETKSIHTTGLLWNAGAIYNYEFKKVNAKGETVNRGEKITFGLYGNSVTGFNTTSDLLELSANLNYAAVDTIVSEENFAQEGKLPAEFSFGIGYEKVNKMRLGLNYTATGWSSYENEVRPDNLTNSFRVSLGGEYMPDYASYNNYSKKMKYRFGIFYEKDPRSSDNTTINNYGISMGTGFPIILPRQTVSFVNLGLELGYFGNPDGIHETYARLTAGFSLTDNSWFFKRKFN